MGFLNDIYLHSTTKNVCPDLTTDALCTILCYVIFQPYSEILILRLKNEMWVKTTLYI
jgi:hypothetical protein